MEIYDTRYFNINKSLLMKGGLWPYEKNFAKKFFSRLFVGISIFTLSLPQVICGGIDTYLVFTKSEIPTIYGLYKNFGVRADKIIEHLALLMFMYGIFLKLVTATIAENNLKKVYESIAENWATLRDSREIKILSEYSENGIILTKGYLAYMIMAMLFYIMLPLTPLLLNVVSPLNETRKPDFIFKGEFPVDNMRDYYIEIFVFDLLGCFSAVYVLVTLDVMYACCIEHCIGLFAIIKHRLKLCTSFTDDKNRDVAYELIVEIAKLHTKTIGFTDLLEESYSLSFFFLMGMNMLYCSFVSVLILLRQNEVMEVIRYGGILGGLVMHLFYISWPGQKLIDFSTGLFDDAYTNEWYKISRKSQDLLRFMRLRCLKPCQLTAGGIYVMNLENFAVIIKTSGSYITVFASFT